MKTRVDDWWRAGNKRAIQLGAIRDPRRPNPTKWEKDYLAQLDDDENFPPAALTDVWVIWRNPIDLRSTSLIFDGHENWIHGGYGLTCPNEACNEGVHRWEHATGCMYLWDDRCKEGGDGGSCWTWTGSVEDDSLSATPSLFAAYDRCGWHGWLKDSVMTGDIDPQFVKN